MQQKQLMFSLYYQSIYGLFLNQIRIKMHILILSFDYSKRRYIHSLDYKLQKICQKVNEHNTIGHLILYSGFKFNNQVKHKVQEYIQNILFNYITFIFMKTGLLTSSSFFGKYVPNESVSHLLNDKISTINLKQNFVHQRPFVNCKFDIPGNRLYLLDTKGDLINLSLNDNAFSTLKGANIQNFTVDGNNSLNILYVTQKSELFQVSFDNKKSTKITNLNMNKIKAFQRNYLRDMLLSLDYKLLFLCDVNKSNQLKIKSLKADKNEVFTNACFASNNRFIILAIKNVEIRILQIMDLKSVHQIKLPFVVDELKLEVSYDSRKIAIYGECNIVFFINILEGQKYQYELIQIPFVKSVVQLRYTSQNDIIFLGSDQVLYAISPESLDKAVPIFNEQFKIRTMSFDISLDCSKIALVSNRTVLQLKFEKGLKYQIQERSAFKQMEYRRNGFEGYQKQSNIRQPIIEDSAEQEQEDGNKNNMQYEDEDDSESENQENIKSESGIVLDNLKRSRQIPNYKQQCGSLHSHVADLKGVSSQTKAQINSVLNNLFNNFKNLSKWQIQPVVRALLKLTQDYKLSPEKCYQVLDFVTRSVQRQSQKFRHYGLIICPEIVAIIERKLGRNFTQFCQQQILSLFSNYFKGKQWKQAINWLLSAGVNQKPQNLSIFLICILEHISELIATSEQIEYNLFTDPEEAEITFATIYNRVIKMYVTEKYKNLFSKRRVKQMVSEVKESDKIIDKSNDDRLEELISRQDQIKRALAEIRKNKKQKR